VIDRANTKIPTISRIFLRNRVFITKSPSETKRLHGT